MNRCKAGLVERTYINSFTTVWAPEDTCPENEPIPRWIPKTHYDWLSHRFGCELHRCKEAPFGKPIKCISRCKLTNEELVELSMGDNYPLCFEYCRITTCHYNRHSKHYSDLLEDSYESEREAYYD